MKLLRLVTVLAIIGAINWGLIGIFNWNLVDAIFGGGAREMTSGLSRVIYTIVGLAGVALAVMLPRLFMTERGTVVREGRVEPKRRDMREPPRPQI